MIRLRLFCLGQWLKTVFWRKLSRTYLPGLLLKGGFRIRLRVKLGSGSHFLQPSA